MKKKIRQAVQDTQGMIVTVDGKAVSTPYFAVCGGHTANSEDVWNSEKSWLKGVPCEWDKEAPKYKSNVILTLKETAEKLSVEKDDLAKMTVLSRSSDGRITKVQIGEKVLSGSEMRSKLELNSTNFSWKIADKKIKFQVTGYGHGVGMCQYGAGGMAKEGYSAEEIIKYYYKGVEIEKVY